MKINNSKINYHHGTASGNNIHIEDSSNLDFAWKIKGGYKQKTYSGNNKLDFKNFLKNANAKYTEQNGVFNLADNGNLYSVPYKLNLKPNTTYTIYQNFQKQNSTNVRLTIVRGSNYEKVVESYSTSEAESYRKKTFTTDENSDYYIRGDWSLLSFPLIYNEPILVEGTDAIPYEPYTGGVPSPNLKYPQEIETVGSNVNLFDGELESGSLTNNTGQNYGNAKNTRSKNYLAVEENTTYALSDNINGSFIVHAYDKDKNWLKMIGASNYTGKYIFTTPTQTAYIRFRTNETDLTAKIKLERGSAITPYSPPGMGCVKMDVVNSNLLDFNVAQNSRVTVNEDGTLTINGTGGFSLNIDKLQLKAGTTYYQKVELISGSISGSNINNTFLSFAGTGAWISSEKFSQTNSTKDTEKTSIWVNASAIFNNAVIKIWANTDESDFILHQSQTAIMPIQQEMLDGDYTADVEHHEWGKAILSGNEDVIIDGTYSGITQFKIAILNVKKQSNPSEICVLSNYFLGVEWNNSWTKNNSIVNRSDNSVRVMTSKYTTIDGFKALLKSKYDEGNPVVIYYKLEKTINLELTEEQKTVRDTKLYTYKNITNINVSDELASVEVEYKKDQDTINKNYENRLAALEAASIS